MTFDTLDNLVARGFGLLVMLALGAVAVLGTTVLLALLTR